MLLSFFKVVADVLYMIPQGAVGVWLIVVCRQSANGPTARLAKTGHRRRDRSPIDQHIPHRLRTFVDSAILHGPISDDDPTPPGTDRANGIVHLALAIGTLIGCSTYPIWTALAGRWLILRRT